MNSHFIKSWIKSPKKLGAIAPSSARLARKMTEAINSDSCVLELGPGTGVITKEILKKILSPTQLSVIEQDLAFSNVLSNLFPDAHVINGSATDADLYASIGREFDFIISSLPLVLFSDLEIDNLLKQLRTCMHSQTVIYQFTYGKELSIGDHLEANDLVAQCVGSIFWNIPPARVFRLSLANETVC
jgi:phosphatidylethanolamine/phosphatidyl-N-methylethanolamine N-methyltransferase